MAKRAKPAVRSKTMWGAVAGIVAVAIPVVQQRLASGQSITVTEAVSLGLGVLGAVMVAQGRLGEPAPVRGLFRVKGSR